MGALLFERRPLKNNPDTKIGVTFPSLIISIAQKARAGLCFAVDNSCLT